MYYFEVCGKIFTPVVPSVDVNTVSFILKTNDVIAPSNYVNTMSDLSQKYMIELCHLLMPTQCQLSKTFLQQRQKN